METALMMQSEKSSGYIMLLPLACRLELWATFGDSVTLHESTPLGVSELYINGIYAT
jgi:hypothetical protein